MRLALLLALAIPITSAAQPIKIDPPKTEKKLDPKDEAERLENERKTKETAQAGGKAAAGLFGFGLVATIVIGILLFIVNLIPSAIAIARSHPNTAAIVAVNLLLGCTGIGWVVALVWALTNTGQDVRHHHYRRGRD